MGIQKNWVAKNRKFLIGFIVLISIFYLSTFLAIRTIIFECESPYYMRKSHPTEMYIFNQYLLSKNENPDSLLPFLFMRFKQTDTDGEVYEYFPCDHSHGQFYCRQYVFPEEIARYLEEEGIKIDKNEVTSTLEIIQTNFKDFDAVKNESYYEFNKEKFTYELSSTNTSYCKVGKIKF